MAKILCLLTAICLCLAIATEADSSEFATSFETFRHDLFGTIAESYADKNIIFSPFSIQTCLAMVRMGAAGVTAEVMDKSLGYSGQTPESVADNYYNILAKYQDSNILKIANKVYFMEGYELQAKFNEVLSKKFLSPAVNINFAQSEEAANVINTWIESKTNNLIKDLVPSALLSSDTRLVLVNAVHFNGEWIKPFDARKTKGLNFYTDETNNIEVPMMSKGDILRYYEFPELDAAVITMPYKDSDISMWIFLPNTRTGLPALEKKLSNLKLPTLAQEMKMERVNVQIPKFKAEFEIELRPQLTKMGLANIFGSPNFSKMLTKPVQMTVSKVLHKAVIDVNEIGTEAAAATAVIIESRTAFMASTTFTADHSFYYVIASADFIPLFQGTFVGA